MNNAIHWNTGNYKIVQNWIGFEVHDYEPKIYLGVPQAPPPNDTWKIPHFDGRVLESDPSQLPNIRYEKVQ